jgi:TolB protein
MNLDGTGLTNLTQHPAEDWEHRWSSTGAEISFLSDRDGGEDLYIMDRDGSNPRRITDLPTNKFWHQWSPTGTKIAFVSILNRDQDVYVVNADGSGLRNLTQNPARDWRFAWSSDGRKIAFVSDRDGDDEIFVINADGTGLRQLTNNLAMDTDPVWSPDGSLIVFESNVSPNPGDGGAEANVGLDLYTVASDGSSLSLLTTDPDLSLSYNPAWSKDGRRILFASILDFRVWPSYPFLINTDGTGLMRISEAESFGRMSFSWSPDGKHIALRYGNSDAYSGSGSTVAVFNAGGTNLRIIESNSQFNTMLHWTQEGDYLVFSSGSDEIDPNDPPFPAGYGINIVRADGSCFTRLTDGSADDEDPLLSPE